MKSLHVILFQFVVLLLFAMPAGAAMVLYDQDFDSGWVKFNKGNAKQSSDRAKFGTHSLVKTDDDGYNGAYKSFTSELGRNFVVDAWLYSPDWSNGNVMELTVSSSSDAGYGVRIDKNDVRIKRIYKNNKGKIKTEDLSSAKGWTRQKNSWFKIMFMANEDDTFTLEVYDASGNLLANVVSSADTNHGSFDRIRVHGNKYFYVDGLKVSTRAGAETGTGVAQQPLFVSSHVPPNLMFLLDNSGSMLWSYLPDGIRWKCRYTTSEANRALGRSHDYNKMYFNPSTSYLPPIRDDGSRYPNSDYFDAWTNGYAQSGGVNLNTSYRAFWNELGSEGSYGDEYCGQAGPADYYTFREGCSLANAIENSACYDRHLVSTEQRQNFANWFSYYRRRDLAARAGIGEAFADLPNSFRLGWGVINQDSKSVDGSSQRGVMQGVRTYSGAHKEGFYQWLHTTPINGSTPLRRALQGAGNYFSNTSNTGPYSTEPGSSGGELVSCRQNFTILMSDGYWNGSSPSVGNADSDMGDPYADAFSNTLADVAAHYWKTDLASSLTDNVPTTPSNKAFWQHMATYTVGLGVFGDIDPQDAWAAVDSGDKIDWVDPDDYNDSHPSKIDDMLHAAMNGRGDFFSASDPGAFATELQGVLGKIVSEVNRSASSFAADSAVLTGDTHVYRASFDSDDWSGDLAAFKYSPYTEDELIEVWRASAELPGPSSRNLFTIDTDPAAVTKGLRFVWSDLTDNQRALLNDDPDLLDYLRGNQGKEEEQGGSFRDRSSALGDFVNSNPVYVSPELSEGYADAGYQAFVSSLSGNPGMIYIGGNDGMLHGFNAETGEEEFAFVPHAVFENLAGLADPDYSHRYFVDGDIAVRHVKIDGAWRAVLVAGLGAGGKSLFALDVTDPANFDASDVLWEFSHDDLGYTFAVPGIAPLSDGSWAVVYGNGYHSSAGKASLLVVNVATGELIGSIELDTEGDNGLSSPYLVLDEEKQLRYAFAGDLKGNMWKVDFCSGCTPDQWGSVWSSGATPEPLFTTPNNRPITSKPFVGTHPEEGYMVYFGTGKYFEEEDAVPGDDPPVDAFYGLRDTSQIAGVTELLRQEIKWQQTHAGVLKRVTTSTKEEPYKIEPTGTEKGWYMDLIFNGNNEGEQVIFSPVLNRDRIIFTTLIANTDPCSSMGSSYAFFLDALDGSRLDYAAIDLNGDGDYTDDQISIDGHLVTMAAFGGDWMMGEPSVFETPIPDEVTEGEVIPPDLVVLSGDEEKKSQKASLCIKGTNCPGDTPPPSSDGPPRESWRQLL
jgi:type IV pilus assembly protein PilY1